MGKEKRGAKQDPATEAFLAGCQRVRQHPLFSRLMARASIVRRKDCVLPEGAWMTVDRSGILRAHPTRRGTPEEWAHVIAHCLLHLGFDHFAPCPTDPRAWNTACCLFIERFLIPLRLGRPPEGMGDCPDVVARSEEALYRQLIADGMPANLQRIGAGGATPDMDSRPAARWYGMQSRSWPDLFADGLADAVAAALEKASDVPIIGRAEQLTPATRRARDWLIASYPLLGGLAAGFTFIEDPKLCQQLDVSVAAVLPEAREIYLNPAAGLAEDELRFIIAHEILHAGLRHDARRQGRDPYLWNVACDYVINAWLVQMRVGALPAVGALYDATLGEESAESLYDRMAGDLRVYRKLATFRGRGLADMLEPRPGWWERGEGLTLDEFYRRALTQGLTYHQARGRSTLPSGLVEEIRALDMRPIPWDVALARWFDEHFPPLERRRSYARPSRRQGSTPDIPLPRYLPPPPEAFDARTFGVVLDTSGSMDRLTLARGLGAIAAYATAHDVPAARVVFCDAAPYDQGYLAPEAIAERVKVRGRGGTVLQPAIDLLEHAKDFPPDGPLLIITDGAIDTLRVRREHAYLMPAGGKLPFTPRGPVFHIEDARPS